MLLLSRESKGVGPRIGKKENQRNQKPSGESTSSPQVEKVHDPFKQEEKYNGVELKSGQNSPCIL